VTIIIELPEKQMYALRAKALTEAYLSKLGFRRLWTRRWDQNLIKVHTKRDSEG
jgi:hypothetical protein